MQIRDATPGDWPRIWPFLQRIVAEGETFTYPRDLGHDEARALWLVEPPGRAFVAADVDGAILGTAKVNPNQRGPGAHVANASFMVDPEHAGRGVGRALCEHALRWAREQGFRAMQFNAVVESNVHAVALYRSLGFEVLGTVPEGFHHPTRGYVGLHILHRSL